MKKIVRGNDFTLRIPVKKIVNGEQVSFPLTDCTDIAVHIVSKYKRTALPFSIDKESNDVLLADVDGTTLSLGTYALEVTGVSEGANWRSYEYEQFAIVDNNASSDTVFEDNTTDGDTNIEDGNGDNANKGCMDVKIEGFAVDTALVVLPPISARATIIELIANADAAIAAVRETEAAVKASEDVRVESETLRQSAEEQRAESEATRQTAETQRTESEMERVANEEARKANEEARVAAEEQRATTFTELSEAANAAVGKVDEAVKSANAAIDKTNVAENERADAERQRTEAEATRSREEGIRQESETERVRQETARETAEATRQNAEVEREKADVEREKRVSEAISNTSSAAKTATDAAAVAMETAKQGMNVITEAERVNAELRGNVLTVTDRTGEVKTLDLMDQEETSEMKAAIDEVVPKVGKLKYDVNGEQVEDSIKTSSIGYHTGNSTKDGNHFTASDKENVSADYALKSGHKYLIAYKGNNAGYLTIKTFTNSGPQPTTIDTQYMRGEYIYKFFSATQKQDGQFVGLAVVSTNNMDNNYYLYVFDVTDIKATEEEILAVAKDNVESGILSFDGKVDKTIKKVAKNTEDIAAINKTLTDVDLQYISKKAKLSPSYGTINVFNCVKAKGNTSIDDNGILNVVGNNYAADGVEVKFGKKYLCYVEYLLNVYYTLRIFNNSSYEFIENNVYHTVGETNLFVFTAPSKGREVMQVVGTTSFPQSPVKIVMLDLDGISESEIELLKTLDYSPLLGKTNADCPIDNLTPLVNKAIYGKFYDYPLSVIGDSLSTRLEFLEFLKEKLHIIDAGSSVMGGTRISGNNANSYWQDKRVNAISADAKLVIIYGGMNDAGSFTVGDMNIRNYDTNTVVGAMNVLLSKLYYRYTKPSKGYYQNNGVDYSGVQQIENPLNKLNIIIITPPQRPLLGGYEKMAELAPKITEIARMWSIPCANGYAEMQYNTMLFDGSDVHYAMNWDDNLAGILKEKLMALEPIIDNQYYKTNKNTITVSNSTSYSVSIAASAYEADYVNFHINTSASPTIVVKDADGETIQLTDLGLYGDKKYHYYSFIMPASEVTITVS